MKSYYTHEWFAFEKPEDVDDVARSRIYLADEADAEMHGLVDEAIDQKNRAIKAESEIARLRKALEFYGDRETYIFNDTLPGKLIDFDDGVYARKILAPEKEAR